MPFATEEELDKIEEDAKEAVKEAKNNAERIPLTSKKRNRQ